MQWKRLKLLDIRPRIYQFAFWITTSLHFSISFLSPVTNGTVILVSLSKLLIEDRVHLGFSKLLIEEGELIWSAPSLLSATRQTPKIVSVVIVDFIPV